MYGSPLLSSYLGKPLKIAGSYIVETPTGVEQVYIDLSKKLAFIPDPAIHLSKDANATLDKGHLFALISSDKTMTLEKLLDEKRKILSHNLYLVSSDEPKVFAENLIASPRMDNLSSSFALLEALLSSKSDENTLSCVIFYDHEEIGSLSLQGAQSHLLKDLLNDLIQKHYGTPFSFIHKEAYSIDVAHANHASFLDKYDIGHPIYLNHGIVIKHHAQHRYAQDLHLYANLKKTKLPFQEFTMRNEIGTGSTLGPYFTTLFGCPTQDIGIGLLGMHSTCEIIGEKDLENLISFAKGIIHG
jgi:aspartyl aminopeptidase